MAHTPVSPDPAKVLPTAGPYSHGLFVDPDLEWLFVSGQMGIAPDGTIPPDIGSQTRIVWTNCGEILAAAGFTMQDVVRVTHYVTDADNLPGYNQAREPLMDGAKPASTLLVISGLAKPELLVEVDMIAARKKA